MKCVVSSTLGCAIGPGQRLKLTEAQIATRLHALTVLDNDAGVVEPSMPITFKRGEILNLPGKFDDLSSYLKSVLEPVAKVPAKDDADAATKAKLAADRKTATDAVAATKAKLAAATDPADIAMATDDLASAEHALANLKA
ncbi:MAG: hypothetical protein KL863_08975 [Rhizobium sp.]|nr:hypothetical protein [Rhizobium sp.]